MTDIQRTLTDIITWAQYRDDVRAVLLTSSRASKMKQPDALSDLDIVLIVKDVLPFLHSLVWQEDIARVMVRLPVTDDLNNANQRTHYRLVFYEGGNKVDYTLMNVGLLEHFVTTQTLTADLDVGYKVLVDKDDLASKLQPPTYTAYIVHPPNQKLLDDTVQEFFFESTYVAKNLWRGELWPAHYSLEQVMKQQMLRRVLEWYVSSQQDWTFSPGVLGRGLQNHLPKEMWQALVETFVRFEVGEMWKSLFDTIDLFRDVSKHVADGLNLDYPQAVDDEVTAYLKQIQRMPNREASS
ncbi:MAG: aminoglycoside 6-adenylyltransferase [Deinococcota bacterium]